MDLINCYFSSVLLLLSRFLDRTNRRLVFIYTSIPHNQTLLASNFHLPPFTFLHRSSLFSFSLFLILSLGPLCIASWALALKDSSDFLSSLSLSCSPSISIYLLRVLFSSLLSHTSSLPPATPLLNHYLHPVPRHSNPRLALPLSTSSPISSPSPSPSASTRPRRPSLSSPHPRCHVLSVILQIPPSSST